MTLRARAGALLTAAAAVALVCVPVSSAQAVTLGEKATRNDLVQVLIFDKEDGTPHKCTGTAIAAEWILTAAHCVEGETFSDPDVSADVVKVHFSNDKHNLGPATNVDRFVKEKYADLALLHLERAHPLASYPKLSRTHVQPGAQQVTLYGFGRGYHDVEVDWLRKAQLKVVGTSDHLNAGQVFVMKGITGGSNHGDSGGPVIDQKGVLIGVNVIGSHAVWSDPYAESKAVDVSYYLTWINQTLAS